MNPLALQGHFFSDNAPYGLRRQRLLGQPDLRLKRFVDELLIPLPSLFRYAAKVVEHSIIEIERNAGFARRRRDRSTLGFGKIILLLNRLASLSVRRGARK